MTRRDHMEIHGTCDPAFSKVRDVFEENFRSRGEVGAAVALYKDGVNVVDLWGGIANPETNKPWEKDTIVCMMSVAKSMTAIALLKLIDQGKVDLEAPVARYWPEFAQNGKEKITVRCLMSGQAGLLYADAAPDGAAYDWPAMIRAYEVQKPEWEPGSKGGYHSVSCGYLLGEIIHRVSGRMPNQYFADEIAKPLGADYHFSLTDDEIVRTADIIPNMESVTFTQAQQKDTKLGRAWRVRPKATPENPVPYNTRDFRKAVFPSSSGHGNARAVGLIYALMANHGSLNGVHLMSPELIEIVRTESWREICQMTDRPFRYGVGFFLNYPPLIPFGANPRAFGHPGAGGAIGIADPEAGLAFSFSPNFMCAGAGVGERCLALVEAALGKQWKGK